MTNHQSYSFVSHLGRQQWSNRSSTGLHCWHFSEILMLLQVSCHVRHSIWQWPKTHVSNAPKSRSPTFAKSERGTWKFLAFGLVVWSTWPPDNSFDSRSSQRSWPERASCSIAAGYRLIKVWLLLFARASEEAYCADSESWWASWSLSLCLQASRPRS